MSRTQQEIRNYLDSTVGTKIVCPNNRGLDGQCVTLIKGLLNFLGCPTAYEARGNATDVATNYVRDGLAKNGKGWLQVCVNHNYAGGLGHVWIDLSGETNYESNGARALHVTKSTRNINQAQQIVNLDQWVNFGQPAQPASGLPAGVTPQQGTYHIQVNGLRVRSTPEIRGDNIVASYDAGQQVNHYQGYIDANGYRWVVYKAKSGNWRYIARRSLDGKEVFGYCD